VIVMRTNPGPSQHIASLKDFLRGAKAKYEEGIAASERGRYGDALKYLVLAMRDIGSADANWVPGAGDKFDDRLRALEAEINEAIVDTVTKLQRNAPTTNPFSRSRI